MAKAVKEKKEPSTSLVALNSQYNAIASQLIAAGGELTPETEATLDKVMADLCTKADGYGIVIEKLDSQIEFWKYQKEKCAEAQQVFTNAKERLRARMKDTLKSMPDESLQGDCYRFFLAKSADTISIDPKQLPVTFKKTIFEQVPDRDKIDTALVKGEQIPGVVVLRNNKSLRSGRPK